uniref:Putative monolaris n=1 Tax=Rhipicephalus pulchellus TaxID=72859 RepID=L7M9K2_RHIPC
MWTFNVFIFILANNAHLFRYAGALERRDDCDVPPTVEGCSIIRRKWSFLPEMGKCAMNFVCSNHPNAFQTEQECEASCPPGRYIESHDDIDFYTEAFLARQKISPVTQNYHHERACTTEISQIPLITYGLLKEKARTSGTQVLIPHEVVVLQPAYPGSKRKRFDHSASQPRWHNVR